ncbi:MAG TPA: hypothetical protein VK012_05125 [Gemmatimonadales bacterium]|nr:hypothetical protein [Gemmatimonadales bacterium]
MWRNSLSGSIFPRFEFITVAREPPLELPTQHRIPLTWLLNHAGESIRYRTLVELVPEGSADPAQAQAALEAIVQSKTALAVVKRQKETGVWGGNLLGLAPSAKDGIKEPGTIPQYRRLLQLAWPAGTRPFKLADRLLFRLLSRDDDPALLFEFQKLVKAEPAADEWARGIIREAASAALAEAGYVEDPRLRGSGHKIASAVSSFLRSPLAEKPFVKHGSTLILHPEANPPSWYSVAMLASMPNLRRERAGFTERLGLYLAQPAPKKAFVIRLGKKSVKPQHLLLGDPIEADSRGNAKDIPLALHYIELLARMGALQSAPVATRVLHRLLADLNEDGVWAPRNLRSRPKATNRITWHYFPLEGESKALEGREADVTFRLALIAKLLGWELAYS